MELRHLQALTAISDHGTFSAAAEHLGTVQSNISAHVARLEKELGAPLIDRADGRLTEEGTVVVARARRILVRARRPVVRRGRLQGRGDRDGPGGDDRHHRPLAGPPAHGRGGPSATPSSAWSSWRATPPDSSPSWPAASSTWPSSTSRCAARTWSTRLLFEEDLMLVVPEGHAMADPDRPLALEDLADLELLLPLPGTAFRDELDAVTRPLGITLLPAAEIDGLRLIASLTFEGYGPAILPATAIPAFLRDRFRPVAHRGAPPAPGRRGPAQPRPARPPRPGPSSSCSTTCGPARRPARRPARPRLNCVHRPRRRTVGGWLGPASVGPGHRDQSVEGEAPAEHAAGGRRGGLAQGARARVTGEDDLGVGEPVGCEHLAHGCPRSTSRCAAGGPAPWPPNRYTNPPM